MNRYSVMHDRLEVRRTLASSAIVVGFVGVAGWHASIGLLVVAWIVNEWRFRRRMRYAEDDEKNDPDTPEEIDLQIGDEPEVTPRQPADVRDTAIHEMGHVFAAAANEMAGDIVSVSVVPDSDSVGRVITALGSGVANNSEWGRRLIGYKLGGFAAESRFLGATTLVGSFGDDEAARKVLGHLISIGNPMFVSQNYFGPGDFPGLEREIGLIFQAQVDRDLRIFEANKELFVEAVERLVEAKTLDGEELQRLMSRVRDPDAPPDP